MEYIKIYHGRIVYGNKNLNKTELVNLSLGYSSQINALWKELTVRETIEFILIFVDIQRKTFLVISKH